MKNLFLLAVLSAQRAVDVILLFCTLFGRSTGRPWLMWGSSCLWSQVRKDGRTCSRSIRNRQWNRGVHVLEDSFLTRRKRWECREEYFWCAAFTAPPTFRWIKDGTCPFYCLGWKYFARGRYILQLWWQCRSFSARRWREMFNFNFFLDVPRIYFSSEIS